MKKRSTLLKVISIILIVIGAFSIFGSIINIAMRSVMEQTYAAMGIAAPTTFSYVLMVVGAIILLVSGIVGVVYKSKQSVLIVGIILFAYYAVSIISNIVTVGFSALNLLSLIWPLLYLWGWYQSN